MRRPSITREHSVLGALAMFFAFILFAVNIVWPTAFAVFIAIGGVIGAFMVLYEVRLTKRIAQAEFIRDLQSGFAGDPNIGEVWRKLLMKEEITIIDRPMVSSYLTFFETLHLLVSRGALEWRLTDDLFRNRFFTAIGDQGILDTALVAHAGSFANIHDLISSWHDHLISSGIPIHPGYYSYVRALNGAKGYNISPLGEADLRPLIELQESTLSTLEDTSWLRANSEEMLEECVRHHRTLGVWKDGHLVAAGVMYDPASGDEAIKRYVSNDPKEIQGSINLKLVLVLPSFRRLGLARSLVELLEYELRTSDKVEILCTIHPKNTSSASLFNLLGYRRVGRASTTYGERDVYARTLPKLTKQWAR